MSAVPGKVCLEIIIASQKKFLKKQKYEDIYTHTHNWLKIGIGIEMYIYIKNNRDTNIDTDIEMKGF